MTTPFIGDLVDCFNDFNQEHPDGAFQLILAEFCGVAEKTVQRWRDGSQMPKGDVELKLKVYLNMMGYRVSELDELPRYLRQLAQLIAFNLLSIDDVRQLLGYVNTQDVYRLLRDGSDLRSDKRQKLDDVLKEKEVALRKLRASWLARTEDVLYEVNVDISSTDTSVSQEALPTATFGEIAEVKTVSFDGNSYEPEVLNQLIQMLSLILENGNQTGIDAPLSLAEHRIIAIQEVLDQTQLRRVITQLYLLLE